jgi:phage shock protein PspC (stress-responsive transcriptional regulator)
MHNTGNLLTRDDTFFGVCQGLGEDLGFNPQYLRAGLAVALFFSPLAVVASYAALGLVVTAARWAYPVPQDAEESGESAEPRAAEEQQAAENEAEQIPLAA